MIAQYDGECGDCGNDIVAGEHRITSDGGGWVHEDCERADGAVSLSTALRVSASASAPDDVVNDAQARVNEILAGHVHPVDPTRNEALTGTVHLNDILAGRVHLVDTNTGEIVGTSTHPSTRPFVGEPITPDVITAGVERLRAQETVTVVTVPCHVCGVVDMHPEDTVIDADGAVRHRVCPMDDMEAARTGVAAANAFLSTTIVDGDDYSDHVNDAVNAIREKAVADILSPDWRVRRAAVDTLYANGMTRESVTACFDVDFDATDFGGCGVYGTAHVFLATVDTACAGCGGEVIKDHHRVTDTPSGDTLTHVECIVPDNPYFGKPRYVPAGSTRKPPGGLRDDRYGRYTLRHPNGTGRQLVRSRVSTVKSALADTYNLSRWQQATVLYGAARSKGIIKEARKLDPSRPADKKRMQDLVDMAFEEGGGNTASDKGTDIHGWCETIDRGGDMREVPPEFRPDVQAYADALISYGLTVVPDMIERTTMTSSWDGVAGTFDNIYRTRDGRYVIGDKKTGKVGYSPVEMYAQFAMYAEGVHEHGVYDPETGLWELTPFDIDLSEALIVHLPAGEGKCHIYSADLSLGRGHLDKCAMVRRLRNHKTPMTGYDRVPWDELLMQAPTVERVKAVGMIIHRAGAMTPELRLIGAARIEALTE